MVQLYVLDITVLPDPIEAPDILKQLSGERREKVLRCSQVKGRREMAGAGLVLKHVFEKNNKNEKEITYGWNGKPEVEGFHFNLSHTEDIVICAVSQKPVGCDIEKTTKSMGRIAKRFFTDKERMYLENALEDERQKVFFRIWTMKESYIKMTGEGMKVPFDSIEVVLEENIRIVRNQKEQNCFVGEYDIPGYCVSVCSYENEFDYNIIFLDTVQGK